MRIATIGLLFSLSALAAFALAASSWLHTSATHLRGATPNILSDANGIDTIARTLMVTSILTLVLALAFLAWLISAQVCARKNMETTLRAEIDQLRRDSMTDPLTGLGNEAAFLQELQREVARAQRHGSTIALALIDLDRHASVTSKQGRLAGDRMVSGLASFLGGRRAEDRTFRVAPGTFALLLPYTTAPEVLPLMEHLRAGANSSEHGTTVSIGLADLAPGRDTPDDLRARAEEALGQAKRRERNADVVHSPKIAVAAS
ncbi:MAG: GGDEF domain-containing protein [Chloroflexota bacterium]